MSIEWMVALVVFVAVGALWLSQQGDAPYQRREAPDSQDSSGTDA